MKLSAIFETTDEYFGAAMFIIVSGLFLFFLFRMLFKAFFPSSSFSLPAKGTADGILEIFVDRNEKDFHVFSYNSISQVKTGGGHLHFVQHYFILGDTGESYYHPLFSFSARSAKGRAGYEGYASFEEDVIPTHDFDESMAKFSIETSKKPELGQKLVSENERNYFINDHRKLDILKVQKEFSKELTLEYFNRDTRETIWSTRI
jgi:hypothetical protein